MFAIEGAEFGHGGEECGGTELADAHDCHSASTASFIPGLPATCLATTLPSFSLCISRLRLRLRRYALPRSKGG